MKFCNNNSLSCYFQRLHQRSIKCQDLTCCSKMLLFREHCFAKILPSIERILFYIRRCTRGVHTPFRCTHIGLCVKVWKRAFPTRRRQRFTDRMVQRQARSLRSAARQIKRTKVHVLDFEFRHWLLRKLPVNGTALNAHPAFFFPLPPFFYDRSPLSRSA